MPHPGTMRMIRTSAAMTALALAPLPAAAQDTAPRTPRPGGGAYEVPVDYRTLPNGLRVVLARDTTAPTVTVAVYYHIGFRVEPRDRTGFAHLFEHLMFQGSAHVGKVEHVRLVEGAGGRMNGHTMGDLTAYYEAVPSGAWSGCFGLRLTGWDRSR